MLRDKVQLLKYKILHGKSNNSVVGISFKSVPNSLDSPCAWAFGFNLNFSQQIIYRE